MENFKALQLKKFHGNNFHYVIAMDKEDLLNNKGFLHKAISTIGCVRNQRVKLFSFLRIYYFP